MKRVTRFLVMAVLALAGRALAQQADHPVISELRFYELSGVNEEFVEIHNPTDEPVDIGGWKLQYKSSTGTTWQDKVTFPTGETLQPRRFLLYGGTALSVTPDYPSTVAPGLGNTGGHVRLVTPALVTIDRVAWLAGDTPEGTVISEAHPRGASYERKAFANSTQTDMAPGGAHAGEGNGWDANNNSADFVIHPSAAASNPQNRLSPPEPDVPLTNGSGTAVCSIAMVDNPAPLTFSITVTAEDHELTTVDLILAPGWIPADLSLGGAGFQGAALQNAGDTLRVVSASLSGAATGVFTLYDVTHPMNSGNHVMTVRTAVEGGTPVAILASPAIMVIGDPMPIEELHVNGPDGLPLLLGQTVVIRGVVTADIQQGIAVYLQDATGGAVCYSASFSAAVDVGDDVTVLGTVTHFNGLMELTPAELLALHATGVEVAPLEVTIAQINGQGASGEPYEGMLLRVNGVTVAGSGSWAGNTNYNITDATGTGQLRVASTSGLVGTPIPSDTFDIIGVLGQYDVSAPYHSGYQLQPRFADDLIHTVGPGITGGPWESEHSSSSVRLEWTTRVPGTTICVWGGVDGVPLDSVEVEILGTQHDFTIGGLAPGTPYWTRVGSADESGASMGNNHWFSTVSLGSPGTIDIFFTKDAELEHALPGNEAQHNQQNEIVGRLTALIDAAETSIDCAIYSLNINAVATALINAHNRGVAVRFIYDADHAQSQVQQLVNAGITVIDNSFGQHASSGIQHNKFMVFDAADGDPANDRVWTGSVNLIDVPSNNGIFAKDNAILIADQAVARAYTLEFNEMWGAAGMTPSAVNSRFGEHKANNTPHYFLVGGVPVEIWFSQGDNVSQRIVNALATVDQAAYFCIFSFTRNEIGYAMRDAHLRGAAVRGVFDTQGDQFSEWTLLQEAGADIHVTAGTGILHHKYLVIDAEAPQSQPLVIAGSYNWSNSAENQNDENTIIFHDALIANQYLQEFAARYHQAGGTGDFNDVEAPAVAPRGLQIAGLYPNPFNPVTRLELELSRPGPVRLQAFDLAGRLAWSRELGLRPAGRSSELLDFSGQASGLYVLRAEHPAGVATTKLLFIK